MVDETAAASNIAAAEDTVIPPETVLPPEATLLTNLVILPPRSSSAANSHSLVSLRLPPIRAEEPVQSLRAALAEVVGFAHMTNFRFELEQQQQQQQQTSSSSNKQELPLVSPFTGHDAVVSVPTNDNKVVSDDDDTTQVAVVLDEYGDLTSLLEKGLDNHSAFRMVLERYDSAGVKEQVHRLRSLLGGNAPSVTSLVDDTEKTDEEEEGEVTKEQQEEESKEKEPIKKSLPKLPEPESVKIDGTNLQDFFYLACGEDPNLFHETKKETTPSAIKSKKKKKSHKQHSNGKQHHSEQDDHELALSSEWMDPVELVKSKLPQLNQLDEATKVTANIQYSGFHPPPPSRRFMGDIAYLEVTPPKAQATMNVPTIHITATSTGFYVNRSGRGNGPHHKNNILFDPSPAPEPCFAHTLLDCLLQASSSFYQAWETALQASKERAVISSQLNQSPFQSLFRVAIRGDFDGFSSAASAMAFQEGQLDATIQPPLWLSPLPRQFETDDDNWNRNMFHSYNLNRTEDDLTNTFGVDIRSGAVRDWNEELQLAREMPTDTLSERLERARVIHKVLTEFGEASLSAIKAISEGQVQPMNPNEAARSQVYLHNNIFFSRAVDAGPETFKIARGDRAARKSANRDIQCVSTFHRMEKSGLHTLATVLIDYLGTRFVCQSVLPGILIGEKSHTLLYGSVEAGAPLKWNEDFHKLMEQKIGEGMMVATRPVLRNPLSKERLDEIQQYKNSTPIYADTSDNKTDDDDEEETTKDPNERILTCVPIEGKGILGSDRRKYVLDFCRLTPRDANWIPEQQGGTGKWEEAKKQNGATKGGSAIPLSLDDDEWTMNVLRPELVSRFTQIRMGKYLQEKKAKKEAQKKEAQDKADAEKEDDKKKEGEEKPANSKESGEATKEGKADAESEKKEEESSSTLTEEDVKYLKTLRLNINVFLPGLRSFENVNEAVMEQMKADEQSARDAAAFLWDEILPKITTAIKQGTVDQIPVDGKTLTEFLHRNGVNCRYLGRLAVLAKEQEEKDAKTFSDLKQGRLTVIERRTMPKCWLELLECEMVARAAKHVLDSYLIEHGGVAATQPAQTIASFFSALVSESEETAAQTETRLSRLPSSQPDEEDFNALTICGTGGDGDAVLSPIRGRHEVWQDIELEVGRRFRYSLELYNKGANKSDRALYVPLLRRLCQRTGVRLVAKNYDVGGKCLCSGGDTFGGRLTASYPISPLDIVDIVPLVKHAASYSEGFTPCSLTSRPEGGPPLQVSLQDARAALERAHLQYSSRSLPKALDLAQEAASLYQRVTENAAHPGVIESLELMATIFLTAGDPDHASSNASKALGLAIQNGGFDAPTVYNLHMSLFQMLFAARQMDRSVKHLRAAIYLLEIMGGPNHIDHFSAYHKLGSIYSHEDYNKKYLETALKYCQEVSTRDPCDHLMNGLITRTFAKVQAGLGEYKDALESEKKAYRTLSMFLGKEHQWTKDSDQSLKDYTKLAVEKGNRKAETEKMKEEAAKAEALAADLVAEEERAKKKSSSKKKKNKK